MRKEDKAWMDITKFLPTEEDENRYGEILVSRPNQQDHIWMPRKVAIQNPATYPFWKRTYFTSIPQLITTEIQAINRIPIVEANYEKAIELIYHQVHFLRGRLITSGIGKAGQIAHNLATTFCSTGTPAYFLNPVEAMHGDLGMLTPWDAMLLVSNSGKTRELIEMVFAAKEILRENKFILITGNPDAALGTMAEVILPTGNPPEVCPLGLTPTTSITCMTVIGDILVTMMMEKIHFEAKDYYARHHGGYLGQKSKEMISNMNAKVFWKKEQEFKERTNNGREK